MPEPTQNLIPPPKTSIWDVTLAGTTPEELEARKPKGFLAKLFGGKTKTASEAFEDPALEAETQPEAAPVPPPGLPRPPKTSIFDTTLSGVPDTPAAPMPPPAPSPALRPLPPMPKTSIFDITNAGVALPPEALGLPAAEPPAPLPLPQVIEQAKPEPKASPAPPPHPPVAKDLRPMTKPTPKTQEAFDDDEWDHGTEVEHNPDWVVKSPQAAPEPEAVPVQAPAAMLPRWVWPVAAACMVGGMFLFLRPAKPSPEVVRARQVPAALQPYYAQAEAGDVRAMRMIGLRYCYGISVPLDAVEGTKWLRRAAKAGNATAHLELAAMGGAAE